MVIYNSGECRAIKRKLQAIDLKETEVASSASFIAQFVMPEQKNTWK